MKTLIQKLKQKAGYFGFWWFVGTNIICIVFSIKYALDGDYTAILQLWITFGVAWILIMKFAWKLF